MFNCSVGVQNQNERPENKCNSSPLPTPTRSSGQLPCSAQGPTPDLCRCQSGAHTGVLTLTYMSLLVGGNPQTRHRKDLNSNPGPSCCEAAVLTTKLVSLCFLFFAAVSAQFHLKINQLHLKFRVFAAGREHSVLCSFSSVVSCLSVSV